MAGFNRRKICEELVDLQREIEPTLGKIEVLKDKLRTIVEGAGDGFTEEIAGKGCVETKPGAERKFKGTMPTLDAPAFLALSEKKRDSLVEQKLVSMTEVWQPARKPSVTVRL